MSNKTEQIFRLSCPFDNPYQGNSRRILFVCSAGLLRSPTAAAVGSSLGYNTRSCGSEEYALVRLSANLIEWAHKIVFVNEHNFRSALNTFHSLPEYTEMLLNKNVVWDIEDDYNFNDPGLVDTITGLLKNNSLVYLS